MQYWQSVLAEVQHKNDQAYDFLFTNRGRLSEIDTALFSEDLAILPKETRDLRTYYLGDQYPGVYFTKREAESLFWLVHGMTIAETAAQMHLSPRTIEFYIKNMKSKLGCASKKRLIEKVLKTNLIEQLKEEGMRIVVH